MATLLLFSPLQSDAAAADANGLMNEHATEQVNEVWELSDAICDIYVAVDVTSSTASILNLVAISIDR